MYFNHLEVVVVGGGVKIQVVFVLHLILLFLGMIELVHLGGGGDKEVPLLVITNYLLLGIHDCYYLIAWPPPYIL